MREKVIDGKLYTHDGCTGCKYCAKDEDEYPCSECTIGDSMWEPLETETSPGLATIESIRRTILREAEKNICGQREQDYGSPETNFEIIAGMWSAYLGYKVTALDVAMMMCLLKIGRVKNGGGTGDSFVDIAGYAACGGEIRERNARDD